MLAVILAGFVVGLVMSAPLGPMAALAALRWSEGARKAAVGVAGGVCFGDAILALFALVMMGVGERLGLGVPDMLAKIVGVVALGGIGVWLLVTAKRKVKPAEAGHDVVGAVLVTLLHPGNIGAFGVMFLIWLPKVGVDAGGLGVAGAFVLVLACCAGMVAGWAAFLWLVNRLVVRFGRPTERVRVWMARIVGGLMLVMAAAVAV